MNTLKEEDIKIKTILLSEDGVGVSEISRQTGIPVSTVSDFLLKKTYLRWWHEYDNSVQYPQNNLNEDVYITDSNPKVLIFDIETAPLLASVWQAWKQNVGMKQLNKDWYMLSWAAKWLDEDYVMYMDCRDDGLDDKNLLLGLHKLLNEADIVITHNGDKFDIPKVRSRMLTQGIMPFSPIKSIDTCKVSKKMFGETYNSLGWLSKKLCPETEKYSHSNFPGFELWKECIQGNMEAWEEMEAYNKQDVVSLEGVYKKLLPWINNHPNMALYNSDEELQCPKCASKEVNFRGYAYTNVSKFRRFQCKSCGGWGRLRVNEVSRAKSKNVGVNV